MRERHDTVVIGGGQAGLAMSYCLRERGHEHIILERRRVAERWHSERWKSLAFQFPNWAIRLPGFTYSGGQPDAFAPAGEIVRLVEDYARRIEAPVRTGTTVVALREEAGRFLLDTGDATTIEASRVVIATGPFQRPAIPDCSAAFPPDIVQVNATSYHSPEQLPPGAVLVVGSGASGCQIAEELYQAGRTVYLSVSRHRRAPRRYRGRDLTYWFLAMGRMDTRIDSFPGRKMPPSVVITGVGGGHDIDVRHFAAEGVVVLGRVLGVADGKVALGDDAEPVLALADKALADFKQAADDHARANGIAGEDEPGPPLRRAETLPSIATLDLKAANVTSVIWSTGYRFDFDWVKLPVLDKRGTPVQERGVTSCPGAYFLGLHWMHTFKSGVIFGVGDDAAHLADHMDGRA